MSFSRDSNWICQFPISLAVEGEACYERMADIGVGRLLFCSMIYSPYRLLLPRYPQKGIYSMEEGRYHYLPERERFRDLPVAPTPSGDWNGRDLLGEAVRGAGRAGISPGAWVTIFANGLIAKSHTPWAVHNLYQSADRLFLCFNNPEVREYSFRVCSEVAERYEVTEIMLDKIPQLCLEIDAFGGTRIDPVLRTLGSICYCGHCVAAAKTYGLDLSGCRRKSLELAAKCLAIPPHVVCSQRDDLKGDTEIPLLLLDEPWISDILRFRIDCIRRFITELRQRLNSARPGVMLSVAFLPPVKIGHDSMQPRPWLAAQSYAAYKDIIELIHCVVHWEADEVKYNTRRAVDAVEGGVAKIVTHIRCYGESRPENLPSLVSAVQRGGASGVGYFCYDLMSHEMLVAAAGLCER
jgi:hypothetical protein